MSKKHNDSKEILATNIRRFRDLHGMGQSDLSQATGIDQGYLSRIENKKTSPNVEKLDNIADAFGIATHELMLNPVVDEYTLREKIQQIESLPSLKKQVIEEMINAFLREQQL